MKNIKHKTNHSQPVDDNNEFLEYVEIIDAMIGKSSETNKTVQLISNDFFLFLSQMREIRVIGW